MGTYRFVQVNEFQANSTTGWNQMGDVSYTHDAPSNTFLINNKDGFQVQLSFLSATAFRVRFRPVTNPDYSKNNSYAVVNRDLGPVSLTVKEVNKGGNTLQIDTGAITVFVGLQPYGIAVYKDGQLITQDTFGKNLVWSNEAVANLKESPVTESYFGFGEKAGRHLDKKRFSLTFFNYDNFTYNDVTADGGMVVPEGNEGGPLNPSSPLYNSMPFALGLGKGETSIEYAYGIFLDNVSQSYFNMGSNDYSDMDGKYYFGALYGELDYYVMVGTGDNMAADVIAQYSKLTGPSPMPPMYALGYQQGGYGYYDRDMLLSVAKSFRDNNIPIDGLHIDVDFQDNYRTFTSSPGKFGDITQLFSELHDMGYKCSTNITGIVSANPMDENGKMPGEEGYISYPTRDGLVDVSQTTQPLDSKYKADAPIKPFLSNTRINPDGSVKQDDSIFIAQESYGTNEGVVHVNPHQNLTPSPLSPGGSPQLGTYGFYSDMARPDVAEWWGEQYDVLLRAGLDMIWQDMTCPAVVPNEDNGNPDKTLPFDIAMYDKVTETQQPNIKVHNSFAIALIEATYNGITKLKQSDAYKDLYNHNRRNFIIARGGYAGVHRYAGLWTGDSASSWDFLTINIPEVLNMGLSGIPITGCDIGGFAKGTGSKGEGVTYYQLFTRWMTMGAFLPWYRNHYNRYTKDFQEPYNYGEPVPTHCRKFIQMRYQLLQLMYDCMYENTQSGMPIARALFLNEPNDPAVFSYADQEFFIGQDLLVAPLVSEDSWYRDVYLPAGSQWYVFDPAGGKLPTPTAGGKTYNWYVDLDTVPLYIRAGAILPIRPLEQYVGQLNKDGQDCTLDFFIYPDSQQKGSSYQLYQDDHWSMDNEGEKGAYRLTQITSSYDNGKLKLSFERSYDNFIPQEAFFYVSLLGKTAAPASLSLNGKALVSVDSADALASSSSSAYWFDSEGETVKVKVFDNASSLVLEEG